MDKDVSDTLKAAVHLAEALNVSFMNGARASAFESLIDAFTDVGAAMQDVAIEPEQIKAISEGVKEAMHERMKPKDPRSAAEVARLLE
jgi:mono/diheme cytochrome c family protein